MLRNWTKLLPVFLASWYARKNCEKFTINGTTYVRPYEDMLVKQK